MKKLLVLLLTLALTLSSSLILATAEGTNTFDYTSLSQYEGYEYDKFDKQWELYGAFSKKYSDAFVVLAAKAFGTKTTVDGVYLYAWFRDGDNLKKIRTIEEIQILADDTLISIPFNSADTYDNSPITVEYANILKTIYEAKDVTIRFCTEMYNYDYSSTDDDLSAFIRTCGIISRHNLVEFAQNSNWTNSWKTWRYNHPITIE